MNLLKVPPHQEKLNSNYCGPAVLHMVFKYFDVNVSEDELAKLCKVDEVGYTDSKTMKQVTEDHGFKVEVKENSYFNEIQTWLDKEIPVIVDWFTRGRSDYDDNALADGHYSIVVGLDDESIYLQDPEIGELRKITKEDFLTVWFDYEGDYPKSKEDLILRQIICIYK